MRMNIRSVIMVLIIGWTYLGFTNESGEFIASELERIKNYEVYKLAEKLSVNSSLLEINISDFNDVISDESGRGQEFNFRVEEEGLSVYVKKCTSPRESYEYLLMGINNASANAYLPEYIKTLTEVGDILYHRDAYTLLFCRSNILVQVSPFRSSENKGLRQKIYKFSNRIDQKICEVNGLSIPELTGAKPESSYNIVTREWEGFTSKAEPIKKNPPEKKSGSKGLTKESQQSKNSKKAISEVGGDEVIMETETHWFFYLLLLLAGGLIIAMLLKRKKQP